MGKVTASVSHELQNVLAIIRETAGLMQDFLMMGDACEDLGERLENNLKSIKNQVIRGVNLTSGLNRFAHTADHLSCAMDVRETLAGLLALTERITRNKGFSVELEPGESPSVVCDPVMFQTLCFLCIETLMTCLPSGQALDISLESDSDSCLIRFTCPDLTGSPLTPVNQSPHWAVLEQTCQSGPVTVQLSENGTEISLTFQTP